MSAIAPSARGRQIAWWLLAAGLTAYLTLSAQGLLALGVPYDAPWGPPIAKIHPGSWLLAGALVVLVASYGHPLRVLASFFAAQPWLLLWTACMGFLLVYSLLRYGVSGAAFIVDTLLMPAVCAAVLLLLEDRHRRTALRLILVLVTLNALLGLGESLLHARLIPLRLSGAPEAPEDYFRPSALLGHPLENAIVTLIALPLVLNLRVAPAWRAALFLLLWVALLGFGGRVSFLLATAGFGAWFVSTGFLGLLRGRYSYVQIVGTALVAIVAAALLGAAIAESGIGERILHSLTWDNSASVRQRVWDVPDLLSDDQLIAGASPAEIAGLSERIGLKAPTEAIENFWLLMFLQFGFVGFVPYVVAMVTGFGWLLRVSGGPVRIGVLLFLASASTTNALGAKTGSLTLLFAGVILTRRSRPPAARPAAPWLDGGQAFVPSQPRWAASP